MAPARSVSKIPPTMRPTSVRTNVEHCSSVQPASQSRTSWSTVTMPRTGRPGSISMPCTTAAWVRSCSSTWRHSGSRHTSARWSSIVR